MLLNKVWVSPTGSSCCAFAPGPVSAPLCTGCNGAYDAHCRQRTVQSLQRPPTAVCAVYVSETTFESAARRRLSSLAPAINGRRLITCVLLPFAASAVECSDAPHPRPCTWSPWPTSLLTRCVVLCARCAWLRTSAGFVSGCSVKHAVNTETGSAVAIKILDKEKIQKQNMGAQIKK